MRCDTQNDYRFKAPPFKPLYVTLTQQQKEYADNVGFQRQSVHDQAGRTDQKILNVTGEQVHNIGCYAEYAVSLLLNLPWDGRFFRNDEWEQWRYNGHDVGGLEVRATPFHAGRLPIHGNECLSWKKHTDNPYAPYILVRTHMLPTVQIVGWYMGYWAMEIGERWTETLRDGRPAIYVPNLYLRPLHELPGKFLTGVQNPFQG